MVGTALLNAESDAVGVGADACAGWLTEQRKILVLASANLPSSRRVPEPESGPHANSWNLAQSEKLLIGLCPYAIFIGERARRLIAVGCAWTKHLTGAAG